MLQQEITKRILIVKRNVTLNMNVNISAKATRTSVQKEDLFDVKSL